MITAPVNMDRRARRSAADALTAVVLLGLVMLAVWFVWFREPDPVVLRATGTRTQAWYVTTYGSGAETIAGILAMDDCAGLDAALAGAADVYFGEVASQEERRASIGVMAAATDRMNEVDCLPD
jgi:hypothetical protein